MCDQAGGLTESSQRSPRSGDPRLTEPSVYASWGDARATARKEPLDTATREPRAGTSSGVQRVLRSPPGGLRCAATPVWVLRGCSPAGRRRSRSSSSPAGEQPRPAVTNPPLFSKFDRLGYELRPPIVRRSIANIRSEPVPNEQATHTQDADTGCLAPYDLRTCSTRPLNHKTNALNHCKN